VLYIVIDNFELMRHVLINEMFLKVIIATQYLFIIVFFIEITMIILNEE